MTDTLTHDPLILDEKLAAFLQRAIEVTLRETFQIPLSLEAWSVGKAPLSLDSFVTCQIRMREENMNRGSFILAFSSETLVQIMEKSGITDTSNPELLDDAATEMANMIYGMVKTNLNKLGYRLQMDIPKAIKKQDEPNTYATVEKMLQPFVADGHRGHAVVAQNS